MAKPSKKQDRREIVEQLRRDQKRAEKKRTYSIIAACTVVALVIIGLGAYPLIRQNQAAAGDLETLGTPAGQADCQDPEIRAADGSSDHRPDGESIPYTDGPPAFGPHYASPAGFTRKFYSPSDRPPVENLVHNLEHGYNVLWYDETIAEDQEALDVVRGIAQKFEGNDFENKFIVAPWTADDGPAFPEGKNIALTHWTGGDPTGQGEDPQEGVWQYCASPSGEVVSQFVEDYPYSDSPEPNAL